MCWSRLGFSGGSRYAALRARQRAIFLASKSDGHFLPLLVDILRLYISLFLMLMKLCFSLDNFVKAYSMGFACRSIAYSLQ